MDKSIYDIICENLTPEGRLPADFSLPQEDAAPNQIRFMVGAMDGIGVFHMGKGKPDKAAGKILRLLKADWRSGSDSREEIAALLREHNAAALMDVILDGLRKNHNNVDLRVMLGYACALVLESDKEELVKLGIALLGLVKLDSKPELQEVIATLGLYDEFTLYAIVAASHWATGNDIIFSIAQKVDGWGKIHAVERLEPATEEIRQWLLRHGCENRIMDAYLGLECAQKGDMIEALRQEALDNELFDGIAVIIDALLDEGPVEGVSAYEHAEEALSRYLRFAGQHCTTLQHLRHILNLQAWLADEEKELSKKGELLSLCRAITQRDSWPVMIQAALSGSDRQEFFYANNAASRLDIDVTALLYEAILREPVSNYTYLSEVYKNPEYAAQLTALYERTLPLEQMATGMGDYLFADTFGNEHHCLDFILQELHRYPGMGMPLLLTALNSPVTRERNGACRVLERWVEASFDIPQEVRDALQNVAKIELNSDTKKTMNALLGKLHD